MNGKRMHAAFQFRRERRVDHAVAFEPALPAEGIRHDIEPIMGFAAGAVSGVTGVLMRLVLDAQALRSESLAQLFGDHILCSHKPKPYRPCAKSAMTATREITPCQVLRVSSRRSHNRIR